ncbi:hypothetical protein K439DRAFT_1627502 [Ramaria rubella]|nr:hypothetical protein K439DRAFT_1627502 [Ramaria rubella]
MVTRPPSETSPPHYAQGYIAFPLGNVPSPVAECARLFHERVKSHRAKLEQEQDEFQRAKAVQTVADLAWQQQEEARRSRLDKLKEEALRAEIEWERMGGRVNRSIEDEELKKKLDEEANLTDEERALRKSWEEYDKAWERLVLSIRPTKTFTFRKVSFSFTDVPWPILRQPADTNNGTTHTIDLKDITEPAVAKFLLDPRRDPKKSRRERLRDAMLRYHPDKFEGRVLPRIIPEDRERVQEGVGIVMKCLNELMKGEH